MKKQTGIDDKSLQFNQLSLLRRVADEYSHLGRDYVLSHLTSNAALFYSANLRRFDGHTIIICVKGHVRMTVDLETIEVPPMSIAFISPDRVFQPVAWEGEELDGYLLFLSNQFVYDVNIDLNAINTNLFTSTESVCPLTEAQLAMLLRYFDMLHINATHPSSYSRHIAKSLTAAAAYQIMAIGEEVEKTHTQGPAHSRKLTYVKNFLRLVKDHHRRERAISFYADKLFISAKYLSLIIKEATGKSAAQWIDQYVIQEAKNQLRYSGKNVQQIAYELNFPNQSSFGKYFKNLTGMSPTKFQNQ